ncbi:MAG: DPP IV N-terminal domain-containing protein, partial [Bradymonadaceae bacterium]
MTGRSNSTCVFKVYTEKRVELDWSKGTVTKDNYEEKVHEFVNAVLEHYTGEPGIFGTKITFVKRDDSGLKQIYIAEMDGSNRVQVTNNDSINMLPSWGNGSVYYTSYRHHNPDLWRYRGGQNKKISSRKGQNSGAAYCGGNLALTLSMGGENTDVYLIDAESGETKKRLTDNWAIDTSPTWSPDCSKIAFVSGRSGSPQIYVMNADGSDKRRLTFKGTYNTSPDWSPKGNKIAFTARDKYNHFDIFLVDLDGNLTRLTQDQGNNEEPSFSPDGRYIIFTSDRGG